MSVQQLSARLLLLVLLLLTFSSALLIDFLVLIFRSHSGIGVMSGRSVALVVEKNSDACFLLIIDKKYTVGDFSSLTLPRVGSVISMESRLDSFTF